MDEWVPHSSLTKITPSENGNQDAHKGTARQQKKKSHSDQEAMELEREHEELTKVKNIHQIQIGKFEIDTWYYSPFPEEFTSDCTKLYICEFCLKYMKKKESWINHKKKCKYCHPPGDEIYRNEDISIFEVDGSQQKVYCQNLCLLAKLFLDHKTLYYDVEPFLFYIMTTYDEQGSHIVGYFSKEKNSTEDYNLACILTLPCYQKMGYGRLLIEFSYELSKIEKKVGTPERPLSDLGRLGYMSYWGFVLVNLLYKMQGPISIKDLIKITAIKEDDILETLYELQLIRSPKRASVISPNRKLLEILFNNLKPKKVTIEPEKIFWIPYGEKMNTSQ